MTTTTTAPTLESLFRSGQEGISSSIINYLENDDKVQFACTCTGMREQVLHGKGVDIPIDPIIVVTLAENWPAIHRGDRFLHTAFKQPGWNPLLSSPTHPLSSPPG